MRGGIKWRADALGLSVGLNSGGQEVKHLIGGRREHEPPSHLANGVASLWCYGTRLDTDAMAAIAGRGR